MHPQTVQYTRSAASVTASATASISGLLVRQARIWQQHDTWSKKAVVAMTQLSAGVFITPVASWSIHRVTSTLVPKQHHASRARHTSGAAASPHRPEHGIIPPQHT